MPHQVLTRAATSESGMCAYCGQRTWWIGAVLRDEEIIINQSLCPRCAQCEECQKEYTLEVMYSIAGQLGGRWVCGCPQPTEFFHFATHVPLPSETSVEETQS